MKSIVLMILLTILTTSCNPSVYFTDNTGKCFKQAKRAFRDTSTFLVFNDNDDGIAWDNDLMVYGPIADLKILFDKEVECPDELQDRFGIVVKSLKKYGVYDEVSKYITIINVD